MNAAGSPKVAHDRAPAFARENLHWWTGSPASRSYDLDVGSGADPLAAARPEVPTRPTADGHDPMPPKSIVEFTDDAVPVAAALDAQGRIAAITMLHRTGWQQGSELFLACDDTNKWWIGTEPPPREQSALPVHVAGSGRLFFPHKTRHRLDLNPGACVLLYGPTRDGAVAFVHPNDLPNFWESQK